MANTYTQSNWFIGSYGNKTTTRHYPPVALLRVENLKSDSIKRPKPKGSGPSTWTERINHFNSYSHGVVRLTDKNGNFEYNRASTLGANTTMRPKGDYSSVDSPNSAVVRNNVRSKFRTMQVNLGMMMAEYPQTAQLFESSCNLIKNAHDDIKHANKDYMSQIGLAVARKNKLDREAAFPKNSRAWRRRKQYKKDQGKRIRNFINRATKALAKKHLGIVYGILPLVSDMNAALALLRQPPGARSIDLVARSRKRNTFEGEEEFRDPRPGYDAGTYKNTIMCLTTISCQAAARAANSDLKVILGDYGLTNPFSLAWEKVHFSFVVDWFWNVGEVLSSMDSAIYTQDAVDQITIKKIEIIKCYWAGSVSTTIYKRYLRGLPTNMNQVATFRYKPGSSLTHIANGFSLLRSIF